MTDNVSSDPIDTPADRDSAPLASDPLPADGGDAVKDPDDWTTGDEPMTDAQRSYLQTLAQQHDRALPDAPLSKAEASKLIDELRSA